jgi:hypothetical protein
MILNYGSHMGFLKIRNRKASMGFTTKMVIHDLDDLGYPHDLGNFHMPQHVEAS